MSSQTWTAVRGRGKSWNSMEKKSGLIVLLSLIMKIGLSGYYCTAVATTHCFISEKYLNKEKYKINLIPRKIIVYESGGQKYPRSGCWVRDQFEIVLVNRSYKSFGRAHPVLVLLLKLFTQQPSNSLTALIQEFFSFVNDYLTLSGLVLLSSLLMLCWNFLISKILNDNM